LVGMAAVLLLGGCWTADDVQKTGAVWRGTYAARYDQLARCMSMQTTPYYKSSLQLDPREQRATVVFSIPVTGIPVEVYDLRQTSSDATEISWETRLVQGGSRAASWGPLDMMRNCGATPAQTIPAAAPPVAAPPPAAPVAPQSPTWAPEPATNAPSKR